MTTIVGSLVFAGLAVYLWRECKPLLNRVLETREKKVQIEADSVQPPAPPTPREALPPTIRQICEQWRDPWAREQAMDYYCELHDETKDWDKVASMAFADQIKALKT